SNLCRRRPFMECPVPDNPSELMATGTLQLGQGIAVTTTGEEVALSVVCTPTAPTTPQAPFSTWDWQFQEAYSREHEMTLLSNQFRFAGKAIIASGDR